MTPIDLKHVVLSMKMLSCNTLGSHLCWISHSSALLLSPGASWTGGNIKQGEGYTDTAVITAPLPAPALLTPILTIFSSPIDTLRFAQQLNTKASTDDHRAQHFLGVEVWWTHNRSCQSRDKLFIVVSLTKCKSLDRVGPVFYRILYFSTILLQTSQQTVTLY